MRSVRFEMRIPVILNKRAKAEAARLGISLAEYIKRLIKADIKRMKDD